MTPTAAPALWRTPHRFSVEDFSRMGEARLFVGDGWVELIEGVVYEVPAPTPPHAGTTCIMSAILSRLTPEEWRARTRSALVLPASVLRPDICVVQGDWRTFLTRHPVPADVGLLVEVADSSLLDDRRDKARLYAEAGIVEYWIVNVPDRRVEVYTQPSGQAASPAYGTRQDYAVGQSVPLVLAGVTVGVIAVSDLFP
jgi:Uma2 family endonuclease